MTPGEPFVHEMAEVDPTAVLGPGTKVWQFSTVCIGVSTGRNCAIGSGAYVGRYTTLGDNVRIQDKAHLTDRMSVGSNVFIGPGAVTVNDRHPVVNNPAYRPEPPVIEDDVSIGGGAVILPGVRLGRGCIVGAGAVVTRDVPPYTTWVGNPARQIQPPLPAPSTDFVVDVHPVHRTVVADYEVVLRIGDGAPSVTLTDEDL